MVAGIAVAAIVVAAIAGGIVMSRRRDGPPRKPRGFVETTPSPAAPATEPPAAQPTPPAPVPRIPPPSARVRARAATARFDDAIVDANRFLAAGDADAATRALNTARAIDPGAPAVADLSARLVEHFRAESARRTTTDPARAAAAATAAGRTSRRRQAQPPDCDAAARAIAGDPSGRRDPAAGEPAACRAEAAGAGTGGCCRAGQHRRLHAPNRSAGLLLRSRQLRRRRRSKTTTRSSVASWRHTRSAIETKDLALYRSVKPNLSARSSDRSRKDSAPSRRSA